MPSLDEDDLNEAHEKMDFDYLADEDVLLQAVIDAFDKTGRENFADVLRVVKRVYNIQTTDLVGNDRMIGARVTFVDTDGEPHRALVLEPEVASISQSECYDPRKDEMVDPSDYPLGTVQLIYGDGGDFGTDDYFFDRASKLDVATSVPPANRPEDTWCYFAGWDYFDDVNEEDGGD